MVDVTGGVRWVTCGGGVLEVGVGAVVVGGWCVVGGLMGCRLVVTCKLVVDIFKSKEEKKTH